LPLKALLAALSKALLNTDLSLSTFLDRPRESG